MIVFSASMPKSGSAWYFHMTNDLMQAAGHDDARAVRDRFGMADLVKYPTCFIDPFDNGKLTRVIVPHFRGVSYTVKTHRGPSRYIRWLTHLGVLKPTYIYRDPRDVVVSFFEHGERLRAEGETRWFGAFTEIEQVIEKTGNEYVNTWRQWQQFGKVLTLQYESLLEDAEAELHRLNDYLQLKIDSATVSDIAANYRRDKTDVPQANLHLNKGIRGRFKEKLSPAQINLCDETFGHLLPEMGYERVRL